VVQDWQEDEAEREPQKRDLEGLQADDGEGDRRAAAARSRARKGPEEVIARPSPRSAVTWNTALPVTR
jgi:hypothetical protein